VERRIGGIRSEAADRARVAWRPLWAHLVTGRRSVVRDRRQQRAPLWPLSQVIHAAALLEPLGVAPGAVAQLLGGLRRFHTPRGWTATAWPARARRVFHDDNAWLGLAGMQSWLMTGAASSLGLAQAAAAVARRGEDPAGGVRWNEQTADRHACATAPTLLLTLRLAEPRRGRQVAVAPADRADLVAFAERCIDFLDGTLRRPDGLIADHVGADGRVDEHVWSYNQGAAIGAYRLAAQVLGMDAALERAQWLAAAAVDHLSVDDRMWREPPAFVSIFMRQLLALDGQLVTHRWAGLVDRYLDRVWLEGRDRRTGLFTAGGIGSYDEGVVIDQAAIVSLCALQAMPVEWRLLAC